MPDTLVITSTEEVFCQHKGLHLRKMIEPVFSEAYKGLSFQSVHLNDFNFNRRRFHFWNFNSCSLRRISQYALWSQILILITGISSCRFEAVWSERRRPRRGWRRSPGQPLKRVWNRAKQSSSRKRWKKTSNRRDKSLEGRLMTRLEERKLIYCRHTDLLLWKSKQMETILLSPIWLTWCLFQALPILPSLSLFLESSTSLSFSLSLSLSGQRMLTLSVRPCTSASPSSSSEAGAGGGGTRWAG